ncbi:putative helicase mov-10-B.1 [Styela clava]
MGNSLYEKQNGKFNEHRVTKLLKNYRSHEAIIKVSNEEIYDNELGVCADKLIRNSLCSWGERPQKYFPVIFHGVRGKDEQNEKSPSFFNSKEVKIVKQYVENLLSDRRHRVKPEEIGIIAPYRSQVQKIRKEIKQAEIKIESVEEFQGQERRVIIISTVRSNEENLQTASSPIQNDSTSL